MSGRKRLVKKLSSASLRGGASWPLNAPSAPSSASCMCTSGVRLQSPGIWIVSSKNGFGAAVLRQPGGERPAP